MYSSSIMWSEDDRRVLTSNESGILDRASSIYVFFESIQSKDGSMANSNTNIFWSFLRINFRKLFVLKGTTCAMHRTWFSSTRQYVLHILLFIVQRDFIDVTISLAFWVVTQPYRLFTPLSRIIINWRVATVSASYRVGYQTNSNECMA